MLWNNKLAFALILILYTLRPICAEQTDPLPSWNEGPNKKAIIEFVQNAVNQESKGFIPLNKRIAAFDQDGTLWVEKPLFIQFFFTLDRLKKLAESRPELKTQPPFNQILTDNMESLAHISGKDLDQIIDVTLANITVSDYQKEVTQWLKTAIHPKFNKPFTDLVYQPMLEVMQLLRDHQFNIYIVSGSGQEFIRSYAETLYGIPSENVIGTADRVKYEYRDGSPVLLMQPQILFLDDKEGKPESINLMIGKHPSAAFGNSSGDQQMLEWTQASGTANLELLVHHDDAVREYAYGEDTRFGKFPEALMNQAKAQGWLIVSMKDDWNVIFPWQRKENASPGNKLKNEELRIIEISYAPKMSWQ